MTLAGIWALLCPALLFALGGNCAVGAPALGGRGICGSLTPGAKWPMRWRPSTWRRLWKSSPCAWGGRRARRTAVRPPVHVHRPIPRRRLAVPLSRSGEPYLVRAAGDAASPPLAAPAVLAGGFRRRGALAAAGIVPIHTWHCVADVDDVLLNALGTALGWAVGRFPREASTVYRTQAPVAIT